MPRKCITITTYQNEKLQQFPEQLEPTGVNLGMTTKPPQLFKLIIKTPMVSKSQHILRTTPAKKILDLQQSDWFSFWSQINKLCIMQIKFDYSCHMKLVSMDV
jgi:hypothetical protein